MGEVEAALIRSLEAAKDAGLECETVLRDLLAAELEGLQAILHELWACPLPTALSGWREEPGSG